jgi:hypothetical protein
MYRLDVMDPVAPVLGEVEATPMAPRPTSLEGKSPTSSSGSTAVRSRLRRPSWTGPSRRWM